jgi:hypothetical protein
MYLGASNQINHLVNKTQKLSFSICHSHAFVLQIRVSSASLARTRPLRGTTTAPPTPTTSDRGSIVRRQPPSPTAAETLRRQRLGRPGSRPRRRVTRRQRLPPTTRNCQRVRITHFGFVLSLLPYVLSLEPVQHFSLASSNKMHPAILPRDARQQQRAFPFFSQAEGRKEALCCLDLPPRKLSFPFAAA